MDGVDETDIESDHNKTCVLCETAYEIDNKNAQSKCSAY